MKKTGIIVAMDKELKLLLPLLTDEKIVEIDGYKFHTGTVGDTEVTIMKCGIGKVNAALGAECMIRNFNPELVINTGVAGGTGGGAKIMDIVIGERIAYHDVWCGPGTTWGVAAGCPDMFTSDATSMAHPALQREGIKRGLVCSGDIFVSNSEVVGMIKSRFPEVMTVDMESAAIAQTCYLRNTPFLCIRVVSDTPGDVENNIEQYESFWEDAPVRTFNIVKELL